MEELYDMNKNNERSITGQCEQTERLEKQEIV